MSFNACYARTTFGGKWKHYSSFTTINGTCIRRQTSTLIFFKNRKKLTKLYRGIRSTGKAGRENEEKKDVLEFDDLDQFESRFRFRWHKWNVWKNLKKLSLTYAGKHRKEPGKKTLFSADSLFTFEESSVIDKFLRICKSVRALKKD